LAGFPVKPSFRKLIANLDCDFRFAAVNNAFMDNFKMKTEDILGKKCHKIISGHGRIALTGRLSRRTGR